MGGSFETSSRPTCSTLETLSQKQENGIGVTSKAYLSRESTSTVVFLLFFNVFGCFVYMQVYTSFVRLVQGGQIPRDWSYSSCEMSCACWGLNPGPVEEQPVIREHCRRGGWKERMQELEDREML